MLNRGDHQERIFADDQDRHLFLASLGEACQKTGWQIHSFCLMSHPFKLELAARLRAQTPVTLEWIARRLDMGTRGHLAQLLRKRARTPPPSPAQAWSGKSRTRLDKVGSE